MRSTGSLVGGEPPLLEGAVADLALDVVDVDDAHGCDRDRIGFILYNWAELSEL
jgi:hypothetical protein